MKLILWVSSLVAVACYIVGPIVDPDLWWHIVVGKWILAHGQLPSQDLWSRFGQGQPWRAYSWPVEILFAEFDHAFGLGGLVALKIIFALILSSTLFYVFGKLSKDWFFGALLGIFCAASVYNHFTLRPQVLVWAYFALLILVAHKISLGQTNKRNIAAYILLIILWANTHVTAIIGIATVCVWVLPDLRLALKLGVLGLASTLISPYLGGEWISFFQHSTHPFVFGSISEFRPATIMQHSTAFLIIADGLLLAMLMVERNAISLVKILLAGGLTITGLAVVKFLPFAVILTLSLVAIFWSSEANRRALGNLAEGFLRLERLVSRIPSDGLAFVLIVTAFLNLWKVQREPVSLRIVPEIALDFIIDKGLPRPILNDFGRGGYLNYRLSNRAGELAQEDLVSIDGRTNLIPEDLWQQHSDSLRGMANWRAYIDRVKPQTILWPSESPLSSILLYGQEWCRVFKTGTEREGYSVFISRAAFADNQAKFRADNCAAGDPG